MISDDLRFVMCFLFFSCVFSKSSGEAVVFGRPNEALVELMPLEEATLQERYPWFKWIQHFKTPEICIHVVVE